MAVAVVLALCVPWSTSLWGWFAPGVAAVKDAAPFASALAVTVAAGVALWTLRLRIRVDDADQWWKRAQYGIDLIHRGDKEQLIGARILASLTVTELPDGASEQQRIEHNNTEKLRKKFGWQVSEVDQKMLQDIVDMTVKGVVAPDLSDADLASVIEVVPAKTDGTTDPLSDGS